MKIANCYTFAAPRERIWPLIYDPAVLVGLIPGCEKLEQIGPDEYRGQIQLRLPAVVGTYQTYVKLLEREEPSYCLFAGEVSGSPGTVKGTALFKLEPLNEHETLMAYEGQGVISGPLGQLDSRFMEGIANTLIKQGLSKLNQQAQAQPLTPSLPSPLKGEGGGGASGH
jgi:carbon monoxide dehydrogenase subunit G